MKEDLSDILASCLDTLGQGEHTMEECLQQHPEYRNDLKPLLKAAAVIRERTVYQPRPGFRQASRAHLVEQLKQHQPAAFRKFVRRLLTGHKDQPVLPKRYAFVWVSIVILAFTLFAGGTVAASSDSLPGDVLYPVKHSVEDFRLLVSDDAGDVYLATKFVQARVGEIQALIDSHREEDLDLAVNLLEERIAVSTSSLGAVAQEDPELAARLSLQLAETLAFHSEVLTSKMESVPNPAKPAIENAIRASNKGRETVQELFENKNLGDGPPEEGPHPAATQPAGRPVDDLPAPAQTQRAGGRPEEKDITDPVSTQPTGDPPADNPGPVSTHPAGGRPDDLPAPALTKSPGDPPGGGGGPPDDLPRNRP